MSSIIESREQMLDEFVTWIDSINSQNTFAFVKTTEEFNGTRGGIWLCGECQDILDANGLPAFEYYAYDMPEFFYKDYVFGVHPDFDDWANERGWFFEWNDPGTIMLWPQ
jgi:hypothetical protein